MNKPRSRRLRKKLHVGEFQEFGFDVDLVFREGLDEASQEAFFDALIDELIWPRGLIYGGDSAGFVCRASRGSVTEEEREAVRQWLAGRKELAESSVGPLVDAWHSGPESMLL